MSVQVSISDEKGSILYGASRCGCTRLGNNSILFLSVRFRDKPTSVIKIVYLLLFTMRIDGFKTRPCLSFSVIVFREAVVGSGNDTRRFSSRYANSKCTLISILRSKSNDSVFTIPSSAPISPSPAEQIVIIDINVKSFISPLYEKRRPFPTAQKLCNLAFISLKL